MKTNFLNNLQRDIVFDFEAPEDKAKRLGVPLIPPKKKLPIEKENPVVGVCGECGRSVQKLEYYSCKNSNCPIQQNYTL